MFQPESLEMTSNLRQKLRLFLFFLLGTFVGIIVLFLLSVYFVLGLKKKYSGRVLPGVYVFSTEVGGMSSQELDAFLNEKEKELNEQKIIFSTKENPAKTREIVPQMIDFSLDKETVVKRLLSIGRSGSKINEIKELMGIYRLVVVLKTVEPEFNYNAEKLSKWIETVAAEIDRPAIDALFEFKGGKVADFQVSENGLSVNQGEMASLIIANFGKYPFAKEPLILQLPTGEVEPKVKTSETNKFGVIELLAEGESSFKDSIPSRVHNINLASLRFHGVVILPGEIFSFGQRVGTISAETGYEKAYVIKENKTILEDGGGVCQVSTTMFRAALNAGLPIVERQAHYYRVGFYEQGGFPPGLDATVYPPSPDLKFKNDTATHILIQTVIDKQKKRLKFQFYGTKDGRKVEISKPVIHSQTPPPPDVYTDDPTLPAGVVKRFDVAHWGAKVSFVRKVFNSDGSLKEEKIFWSNYTSWPAVYQKGTGH